MQLGIPKLTPISGRCQRSLTAVDWVRFSERRLAQAVPSGNMTAARVGHNKHGPVPAHAIGEERQYTAYIALTNEITAAAAAHDQSAAAPLAIGPNSRLILISLRPIHANDAEVRCPNRRCLIPT
jgi:hypothetical protein